MEENSISLIWWITVFEFPVMGALFLMLWRMRRELDQEIEGVRHGADTGLAMLRESLAAYKLDVAKQYASIAYLKDVERRLTSHLVRIEHKLDQREA